MEIAAVIPACGDPAGIPQKPLQKVAGLSLIARAIRSARAAPLVNRVLALAGDDQVADAARAEGAEVAQYGQIDGDESLLLRALDALEAEPDVLAVVDYASPFTLPEDIQGTIQALDDQQADVAFAAVRPRRRLWLARSTGELQIEQGCATACIEAGSVYALRPAGFRQARSRLFGKTAVHLVDEARVLSIHSPLDLYRARQIAGDAAISLEEQPTIYVDVDDTICIDPPDRAYGNAVPIPENIAAINRLYDRGHTIVYWTARGGKSGIDYGDLTKKQLGQWGARYHRLVAGKPSYDLLICDKAIRHVPLVG